MAEYANGLFVFQVKSTPNPSEVSPVLVLCAWQRVVRWPSRSRSRSRSMEGTPGPDTHILVGSLVGKGVLGGSSQLVSG